MKRPPSGLPSSTSAIATADRVRFRRTLSRTVVFLALFAALQGLYAQAKGSWVERMVIDQATVRTAAALIGAVDPGVAVEAVGPRLRAPGGGINVLNGCEGIEVVFLVASAMLVAPIAWSSRLLGLLGGTALVFVLNQARVIALFYAFRSDKAWFEVLHGVLAPVLLVAAAAGFFVFWLNRHLPMAESRTGPAA